MRSLLLAGGLIVLLAACGRSRGVPPAGVPAATVSPTSTSAAYIPPTDALRPSRTPHPGATPAPDATVATATATAVPSPTPTLTGTADPTAVAGAALARQFERALKNHTSGDLAPFIPESGITMGVYESDGWHATRGEVLAFLAELAWEAQTVSVRYAPEVQQLRPDNYCLNIDLTGDVGLILTLEGLTPETNPYNFYRKSLITLRQRDALHWEWVAWIWRPHDPIEPECWGTPTPMRPEHVPSPLPVVSWLTGR